MTATSFTDGTPDSAIASNTLVDLNGPRANGGTKLVDLLKRGDTSSTNVFQVGTLQYTGKKGGRTLTTKSLTIDSTTDVNNLIQFLRDSSGIQSGGSIPTDITGLTAGGAVTGSGTIRMVSNNGVDNAVSVDTTSLTLITGSGNTQVLMDFSKTQDAVGNSAVADFLVYDSLGAPKNVRITAVLEEKTNDDFTYRWFADSPNNEVSGSQTISVGTGLIKFDSSGKVLNVSNTKVSIQQTANPSLSLDFDVDFAALSGLASATPSLAASRQDGFPPGKLTSYIIGEDGIINGVFDNGTQRNLGKIRLARFANPTGLEQRGKNLFAPGVNSGLEVPGNPSEEGIGTIVAGAVELSNTDVSQALIQLVSASTQYRANARVITSAQQLLDELLNIRR
ncbi:MAG: flagellar hook-basal body complex protein, partial [Planctomycetaceae bacterium]|nr:flagellar hook-basal body complex protein [Planctomycetaceae bacterium]